MTRDDYLGAVRSVLTFLGQTERDEVLADMEELYDGLRDQGIDDAAVQDRIGTAAEVAREYRLVDQLDRVDRAPGAAAGVRMGILTLTGRLVRGLALQLFGLVWLGLAIIASAAAVCALAAVAVAVFEAIGFAPVATTLAVPGIPVVAGVLMSLACALGALALLLATRLAMRALAGAMRSRLHTGDQVHAGEESGTARPSAGGRRWIDSGRAAWQTAIAALVVTTAAGVLMPILPAPDFPLSVERRAAVDLTEVKELAIDATRVHVVFAQNEPGTETVTLELSGEMKRTFAQRFTLETASAEGRTTVTAFYQEGLSWGINPYPSLVVTVPSDLSIPVVVRTSESTVDDQALPPDVRARVRSAPRR